MEFSILCLLFIKLVFAEKDVIIKVAPETIMNGIKTMVASGYNTYLRQFADDIATKAAKKLIDRMQRQQNNMNYNSPSEPKQKAKLATTKEKEMEISLIKNSANNHKFQIPSMLRPEIPSSNIDDERSKTDPTASFQLKPNTDDVIPLDADAIKLSPQVLTLLEEPSPDGDNMDGGADLTEEEGDKKQVQINTIQKVNGRYYRTRRIFALIFV